MHKRNKYLADMRSKSSVRSGYMDGGFGNGSYFA